MPCGGNNGLGGLGLRIAGVPWVEEEQGWKSL